MNDDDIVSKLRLNRKVLTPVQLAELLNNLTEGRLSQGTLVMYFKRAFPTLPLRLLLDCGAWTRVGGRTLSDADFDDLLRPWIQGTD